MTKINMQDNKKREIVITSDHLKAVVASYYRFDRQFNYTCTEYQHMDVCACDGKQIIEIECKISKSDLKRELKKPKHKQYKELKTYRNRIIPNKYFFAITEDMYCDAEVVEIIENLSDLYGIIVVKEVGRKFRHLEMNVVKSAKQINKKEVSQKFLDKIVARMASENINLRIKKMELEGKLFTVQIP